MEAPGFCKKFILGLSRSVYGLLLKDLGCDFLYDFLCISVLGGNEKFYVLSVGFLAWKMALNFKIRLYSVEDDVTQPKLLSPFFCQEFRGIFIRIWFHWNINKRKKRTWNTYKIKRRAERYTNWKKELEFLENQLSLLTKIQHQTIKT